MVLLPWRVLERAPKGVDKRLWLAALAPGRAGVRGPVRDLPFAQHQLRQIEAALAAQYRADVELRAAREALADRGAAAQRAQADADRIAADAEERIRRAEHADATTPLGAYLLHDAELATVDREASQAHQRAAAAAEEAADAALAVAERDAIDRLHVAALDGRAGLDAFVEVLNDRLRYHGNPLANALDEQLTDELVQRAVRLTRLHPDGGDDPEAPANEGAQP